MWPKGGEQTGSEMPPPGSIAVKSARPRLQRWLWWLAVALATVLAAVFGYHTIASPDIGFHLSLGRWIAEHHAVPHTEPLSYTASDHTMVDPQWLFQLTLYQMYRIGGAGAIEAMTIGLTLVFSVLLLVRTYRRGSHLPVAAMVMLLLFYMGNQWEIRPHLLSWCWGSLILLVLEEYSRGNRRWLAALPVIMLLWVNTHSLFILGLVLIATYVGTELLTRRRIDKWLGIWAGAALLACLINPYHVHALTFPFHQLGEIQAGAVFKSTTSGIAEFTSPFSFSQYMVDGQLVLFQARLFWQLFFVLAVGGMIGLQRKSRLVDWILFAGFLYIFHSANKNFGYFVMATFPAAAVGLDRLRIRWMSPVWLGTWNAVCATLVVAVWTGMLANLQWTWTQRGVGFNNAVLPVDACRFLAEHRIRGRMLNTWDDGGYIAWTTDDKVFIYGITEVFGPKFYRNYVRMKEPNGFPAALTKWQPTVAIVPYEAASFWLFDLNRRQDWRLVYADQRWGVFLHESVAPEIAALPRAKAGADYPVYEPTEVEKIVTDAFHAHQRNLWQWLQGRSIFPTEQTAMAGFYLQTGQIDACIGTCLEGLKRTPYVVSDLMLTLGYALNARHQYRLADVCFDAFLREDGEPAIAAQIRDIRQSRK